MQVKIILTDWSFVFERPTLGDHTKAHISGLRSENTPIKLRKTYLVTWKMDERPTIARNGKAYVSENLQITKLLFLESIELSMSLYYIKTTEYSVMSGFY